MVSCIALPTYKKHFDFGLGFTGNNIQCAANTVRCPDPKLNTTCFQQCPLSGVAPDTASQVSCEVDNPETPGPSLGLYLYSIPYTGRILLNDDLGYTGIRSHGWTLLVFS